jgi:hypothetical protein
MDRGRLVRQIISLVMDTIPQPVMDKDDVVRQVLLVGKELTYDEKVEVGMEVCRRWGV